MIRRKFIRVLSGLFAGALLAERSIAVPHNKEKQNSSNKEKNNKNKDKLKNKDNNNLQNSKKSKRARRENKAEFSPQTSAAKKTKAENSRHLSKNKKNNIDKPASTIPRTETKANNLANSANVEQPTSNTKPSIVDNPPAGTVATKLPGCRPVELATDWIDWQLRFRFRLSQNENCRLWLPLPFALENNHQQATSLSWQTNSKDCQQHKVAGQLFEGIIAEWQNSQAELQADLNVKTAQRNFNIANRTHPPERSEILKFNIQPSKLITFDSQLQKFARNILQKIQDPLAQANQFYNWVVEQVSYQPSTNDNIDSISDQIVLGQFYGNQLRINVLFVTLCRSVGIPARVISGWQLAASQFISEDVNLGASTRAEFYIPGYGWIAVDPALVCRAKANGLASSKFSELKKFAFGYWENNWLICNVADQLVLPKANKTRHLINDALIEERGYLRNVSRDELVYTVRS